MVSYRYLIFITGFLLCACAQVGTISGGPKDNTAPKPVDKNVQPPNGSTRFAQKEVEIPFDEFFRLDNANINIRMVPAHATIDSRVQGKTLYLSWEDELQENTTYAIYLNNAVKDITEGNDSIIQYVFSTGDELDTLSYSLYVADAQSSIPVEGCVVGIFDPETDELKSFTETDAKGFARLSYLKEGDYKLVAFVDENGDLEIQEHESLAFPSRETISIDSAMFDSLPLRLFSPIQEPEIQFSAFVPPGYALIGANRPIENETLFLNGEQLDSSQYQFLSADSMKVFMNIREIATAELAIHSDQLNDTIDFRFAKSDRESVISFRPSIAGGVLSPWDSVSFFANDQIISVDTSQISLFNRKDSIAIRDYQYTFHLNELFISFPNRDSLDLVDVLFNKGSISTVHGSNTRLQNVLTFQNERKYGALNLDLSYYQEQAIVLRVITNKKVVKEFPVKPGNPELLVEGLSPGDYTFNIVIDENANGRWDVGDFETLRQPEVIEFFSTPTTVRANWEVELSLIPLSDE